MHVRGFIGLNSRVFAKNGFFPVCYRIMETFGYMKSYVRQCKVKRVS
ncbi:Uncharacterised protein [Raoultella ornithinolytica]|nr:Uncharacterised protein [Raoultella ornithinolytica]